MTIEVGGAKQHLRAEDFQSRHDPGAEGFAVRAAAGSGRQRYVDDVIAQGVGAAKRVERMLERGVEHHARTPEVETFP